MRAVTIININGSWSQPIMEAYDYLAAENDILVLEGAGSPAEINLKQEDIVNMGMAELARCAGAPGRRTSTAAACLLPCTGRWRCCWRNRNAPW